MILNLMRRRPTRGFTYASHMDAEPMAGAAAGRCVQIVGRAPPWLVVDHELTSVIVGNWPGRLWAVEVIDPVSARDKRAAGQPPLATEAKYTLAAAVRVLHEVPVAALFGSRGAQVCSVIHAAGELAVERAAELANARHRDAPHAQTRVWKRWLSCQDASGTYDEDLDGTLAVPEVGSGSPIGWGLSVIHDEVGKRAEAIGGPSVWIVDDEDSEDVRLAEPWSKASSALTDAALAFGAPDLMSDEDANILATAWRAVIGPPPPS